MQTIAELLSRDLSRKIEEIIKVDQTDEQSVYTEITEYIATDRIKEQYHHLLKEMAEAPPSHMRESASGFQGSSAPASRRLLKNLGYVLANRTVLGVNASELFSNLKLKMIASALCSIQSMPDSRPKSSCSMFP